MVHLAKSSPETVSHGYLASEVTAHIHASRSHMVLSGGWDAVSWSHMPHLCSRSPLNSYARRRVTPYARFFLFCTAFTYILQGFINASLLLIAWLDYWRLQAFCKLNQGNTIRFSKSVVVVCLCWTWPGAHKHQMAAVVGSEQKLQSPISYSPVSLDL